MDRRTIRSKKSKTRNARPYDRPNQQGILGRVASKVKGLLNPSWIFNVSQWMGTQEEEPGCSTNLQEEEEEESGEEEEPQQPSPRGSKRPRLAARDPAPPSSLSEGTQTWLETPSSSLFNPTSRLTSTVSQNSLIENKGEQVIINGDDHSENSEGSASTSGCSSLVSSHKERLNCIPVPNRRLVQSPFENLRSELSRRDVTARKDELSADMSASRMSLWSGSNAFSPASKLQRRSPAVGHSNQPAFNISAFVGPSKMSQQSDRKVASPFYQGNTSFGGASATRRMPTSVAPYQVERPTRNQIKVHAKSEDSLEGMSSAAKRILMTLEKMSSPVTDAKKIPNTNRSPVDLSLYLMPPKFRSNVVSSPNIKGPPIANISTISKLTTLKPCPSRRLLNHMDSPSTPTEVKIASVSEPIQSPPELPSKGGGKMRNRTNQLHQPSARNETPLESTPLPNVQLPISTLPKFSFEPKPNNNKPVNKAKEIKFDFSNPIVVLPQSPSPSALQTELPTASTWDCDNCWVRNPSDKLKCLACEAVKPSNKNNIRNSPSKPIQTKFIPSTGLINFRSDFSNSGDGEIRNGTSQVHKSSSLGSTSLSNVQLPTSQPKLSFESSNTKLVNETKEIKFDFSNPIVVLPQSTLPSAFQNDLSSESAWECDTCWIRNASDKMKCLACEAPKPSKKLNLAWECDTCWIRNAPDKMKCLACEAPKPSKRNNLKNTPSTEKRIAPSSEPANPPPILSNKNNTLINKTDQVNQPSVKDNKLSSGFAVSDWECDTCWVRNASDKMKCSACETLKPSKRNNSGLQDIETFKSNFKVPSFASGPASFGGFNLATLNSDSSKNTSLMSETEPPLSKKSDASENRHSDLPGFLKILTSSTPTTSSTLITTNTPATSSTLITSSTPISSTPTSSSTFSSTAMFKQSDNSESKKIAEFSGSKSVLSVSTNSSTAPMFSFGVPATTTVSQPSSTDVSGSVDTKPAFSVVPVSTVVSTTSTFSFGSETVATTTQASAPSGGFSFLGGTTTSTPSINAPAPSLFKFGATSSAAEPVKTDGLKDSEIFKTKVPSLGPSTFGGFAAAASVSTAAPANSDSSKNVSSSTTENPLLKTFNASGDKRSDSPVFLGISSSISSPFSITNSNTSIFQLGDKVDTSKTTETSWGKSVPAVTTNSTTTPVFSFGVPAATNAPKTFSADASKGLDTKPAISAAPFSAVAATTTSTFSFGNASTTTTAQATAPAGGFSFFAGTTAPTPSLFKFGAASSTAEPAKTSFPATSAPVFGTASTTTTSAFVFGAVKTEPVNSSPATNFAFGSAAAAPSATQSTFSGFQTNQPTPAPSVFQFGSQPSNNTSTASTFGVPAAFAFGAKSETPNQLAPATTQASGFGIPSVQQPTFGSTAPSAFGKPKSGGFNFGPAAASTTFMQFGTTDKKPAAPQFNFGAPQEQQNATGQFQPAFNISTPPSFNFGASSNQGGPFQFAASTHNDSANSQVAQRKIRKAVRRRRD